METGGADSVGLRSLSTEHTTLRDGCFRRARVLDALSKNLATRAGADAQGTAAAYVANRAFPLGTMPASLTVDESTFQKPKSREIGLVAYKASADVAAKLSMFAITVVAARRLSAVEFGVLSLGMTLGWLAAVAADFGIQLHLARAVARAPDQASALLRRWLRVRAWTALVSIAAIAVGVLTMRSRAAVGAPILVLAAVYAANGLVEFVYYFFRGISRTDLESSIIVGQRAATLVCALVALLWYPTVGALAIAMLCPAVVTLVVVLRIAGRFKSQRGIERNDGDFIRDVAPIGAGILLSALYFRIDVFLVQWWAGTESVALYNAVFRIVEALRLFPAAVLAVTLPALCRARDFAPLVRVSIGIVLGAIVGTAVLWLLADWIVALLYGERYLPAVPAFRILLLSLPLLALNYALTHQVIGWDGQRAYAAICAAALAANVVLNARLIPTLSIDGAAWGTLGTELVVTAGCLAALATRHAPAAAADRIGTAVIG
jgi:O-antigen/teichoic acid export membrane protein